MTHNSVTLRVSRWRQIRRAAHLPALSLLFFQAVVTVALAQVARECHVNAYGAVGDGVTLNTSAINAAIADCHTHGGGTVAVDPGIYRTGTIYLLDNIKLFLSPGATLLGSENLLDYPKLARASEERDTSLIVAEHAHNVSITGPGTIDGNGRAFIDHQERHWSPFFVTLETRQGANLEQRMREAREGPVKMASRPGVLILFLDTDIIALRDFHVRDSPNWSIHVACSNHITVHGLDIRNSMLIPNSDGLDVSASSNAIVSDLLAEAGDDALVFGGPTADGWCQRPAENMTANNVTLHSRSAAIRIGPAAKDVRNFTLHNIVIRDSNRGINLQARSGETVENISFSGIVSDTRLVDGSWWGAGEPISITAAHWAYAPWPPSGKSGYVRHISFSDVTAQSQSPVVMYSVEPNHIEDISFTNVRLTMRSSELQELLGGNIDLQPVTPRSLGLFKHDLAAVLAHGVQNITFDRLAVRWQGSFPPFYLSALAIDGFDGVEIHNFKGHASSPNYPVLKLTNGENALVNKHKIIVPESR